MARRRAFFTKLVVFCILSFAAVGVYTLWMHKDVQNTVKKVEKTVDGVKKVWDR